MSNLSRRGALRLTAGMAVLGTLRPDGLRARMRPPPRRPPPSPSTTPRPPAPSTSGPPRATPTCSTRSSSRSRPRTPTSREGHADPERRVLHQAPVGDRGGQGARRRPVLPRVAGAVPRPVDPAARSGRPRGPGRLLQEPLGRRRGRGRRLHGALVRLHVRARLPLRPRQEGGRQGADHVGRDGAVPQGAAGRRGDARARGRHRLGHLQRPGRRDVRLAGRRFAVLRRREMDTRHPGDGRRAEVQRVVLHLGHRRHRHPHVPRRTAVLRRPGRPPR